MAKLPDIDKIVERALAAIERVDGKLELNPVGQRRLSEREIVGAYLLKTPEQHAQGVLAHGPKAYGEYIKKCEHLKEKYDRRAGGDE